MMLTTVPLLGMVRLAEEVEEETINPVLPVGFEIFWSAVFFLGLWALMKYVLLPPIVEGREARQALVATGQDSVSDSESELAQIHAAHNDRIAAAQSEASAIIDEARAGADSQRSEAVAALEAEIARLRASTQAEIDQARSAALSGARGPVSELATGAAGKVLGRRLDAGAAQSTIDTFLNGSGS